MYNIQKKTGLLKNTVYEISLEIKLPSYIENKIILFFRYYEAIEMAIKENSCGCTEFTILRISNGRLFFRLVL